MQRHAVIGVRGLRFRLASIRAARAYEQGGEQVLAARLGGPRPSSSRWASACAQVAPHSEQRQGVEGLNHGGAAYPWPHSGCNNEAGTAGLEVGRQFDRLVPAGLPGVFATSG